MGCSTSTITVKFGNEALPYHFGYGCEETLFDLVAASIGDNDSLIIFDDALDSLAKRLCRRLKRTSRILDRVALAAYEPSKSLSIVESILRHALKCDASRLTSVIAVGGGLTGNVAGMVAGLMFRGVPLIHLPTTPVAAFDSVLSRKQAVNIEDLKNAAGLFKTPALIAADLSWLETIPPNLMRTGLVEMAKNVLAVRPDYRQVFEQAVMCLPTDKASALHNLCEIGIQSKLPFIEKDSNEVSAALVFEYGHTIGHAIEGASRGQISHGEAVGWGMFAAADLSQAYAGLSDQDHRAHDELLGQLGVSRDRPPRVNVDEVKRLVRVDTKRGYTRDVEDCLPMVLLSALGHPVTRNNRPLLGVNLTAIDSVIDGLLQHRNNNRVPDDLEFSIE
jgi:3-dehydroquinate synthetase